MLGKPRICPSQIGTWWSLWWSASTRVERSSDPCATAQTKHFGRALAFERFLISLDFFVTCRTWGVESLRDFSWSSIGLPLALFNHVNADARKTLGMNDFFELLSGKLPFLSFFSITGGLCFTSAESQSSGIWVGTRDEFFFTSKRQQNNGISSLSTNISSKSTCRIPENATSVRHAIDQLFQALGFATAADRIRPWIRPGSGVLSDQRRAQRKLMLELGLNGRIRRRIFFVKYIIIRKHNVT